MKKILLLLLLSLTFIGSANANSIKGAFGYKLGEVQEPEKKECDTDDYSHCYTLSDFDPVNPLPYFEHYYFVTTFTTNKIQYIKAYVNREYKYSDSCDSSNSDFGKTRLMLEAKYGDFESHWFGDGKWYKFEDGDRSIFLRCAITDGFCRNSSSGYDSCKIYDMELTYKDDMLGRQNDDEKKAFIRKKFEEESKDYDL